MFEKLLEEERQLELEEIATRELLNTAIAMGAAKPMLDIIEGKLADIRFRNIVLVERIKQLCWG